MGLSTGDKYEEMKAEMVPEDQKQLRCINYLKVQNTQLFCKFEIFK